jgi:hypothetical protein
MTSSHASPKWRCLRFTLPALAERVLDIARRLEEAVVGPATGEEVAA